MPARRSILQTCVALFFCSLIFFLINIQFPKTQNFDEFHYVPAAKQFLELRENQNYEHPPLGKELMAIGIALFGDRPAGWRGMSAVFGALTLVGMYLWGLALFRRQGAALWIAGLTLANQLLYVQSRIGMLDTFMFAFITFAMASFFHAWRVGLPVAETRRLFLFCGAMLGFATASKWFGVIPWAMVIGCVLVIRVLQSWGVRFEKLSTESAGEDWFHPGLFAGMRFRDWIICLAVMPLAAYYVTFLPFLFVEGGRHSIGDILFSMQYRMWDGQSRVVSSHPYMSPWTSWSWIKRPIWYAFDKEGDRQEFVRGVLLVGNPLVMWAGLLAIGACLWGWLRERRRDAFLIIAVYAAFYLSWAVIPRKVAFYYYYYPAGMVLSLALAYVFERAEALFSARIRPARWVFLAASLALFAYFFPILAALRIPSESFRSWMWLQSWI